MGSAGDHRRAGVSRTRLATVEPRPFRGLAYRVIGSRFLASPLVSAGSRVRGGRFNPPGEFEVLYAALSVDTALAERDGLLLTAAGIKAARAVRTSVLLKISCRLSAVLDLTDERIRQRLGLSLGDLLGPWVPWNVLPPDREPRGPQSVAAAPCQTLGRAVHTSRRFEAILSPSAKDASGRCLAIFPDRLREASSVAIDDPEGIIRGALGLRERPGLPSPRRERRYITARSWAVARRLVRRFVGTAEARSYQVPEARLELARGCPHGILRGGAAETQRTSTHPIRERTPAYTPPCASDCVEWRSAPSKNRQNKEPSKRCPERPHHASYDHDPSGGALTRGVVDRVHVQAAVE